MPKESKFYFEPMKPRLSRIVKNKELTVRIQKPGYISLSKTAMFLLGIPETGHTIRVFEDSSRRAIGFKLVKGMLLSDKFTNAGYRFLKPYVNKEKNYIHAQIHIQSFLEKIGDITLPTGPLKVDKYKDEIFGEVYYIVVPRLSDTGTSHE